MNRFSGEWVEPFTRTVGRPRGTELYGSPYWRKRQDSILSYGHRTAGTHSQRDSDPATDRRDGAMRLGAGAGAVALRELGLGAGVLQAGSGNGRRRSSVSIPESSVRSISLQRRLELQDVGVRRHS